jgi:peptidyl-prolyl isomerase D
MDADCGQLSGDGEANLGQKTVDSTGDPYEDFPEDQEGGPKGPEVITIAAELKDFGNKAFKAGDLNLALEKYQKGLRYLNEYPEPSDGDPLELAQRITNVRFSLYSNSALIQIKSKAFDDALKSATNAVEMVNVADSEKAKAYFRKALASIGLKDDEQALKDLEEALKLAPGDAAITRELTLAKKKAAEQAKKEKAAYKKFFD